MVAASIVRRIGCGCARSAGAATIVTAFRCAAESRRAAESRATRAEPCARAVCGTAANARMPKMKPMMRGRGRMSTSRCEIANTWGCRAGGAKSSARTPLRRQHGADAVSLRECDLRPGRAVGKRQRVGAASGLRGDVEVRRNGRVDDDGRGTSVAVAGAKGSSRNSTSRNRCNSHPTGVRIGPSARRPTGRRRAGGVDMHRHAGHAGHVFHVPGVRGVDSVLRAGIRPIGQARAATNQRPHTANRGRVQTGKGRRTVNYISSDGIRLALIEPVSWSTVIGFV